MNRTNIEYLTHTWNPYSGCLHWRNGVCQVGKNCWAKRMAERFPKNFPYGFEPTFYPERFLEPLKLKKPARIGVSFMGDLFGDWMQGKAVRSPDGDLGSGQGIMDSIFQVIEKGPQHIFVFLTKCPQNLRKWSPFPPNAWAGVSATDQFAFATAYYHLKDIEAGVKVISMEPLLSWDMRVTEAMMFQAKQAGITWLILGSQTQPYRPPKIEWVLEIVEVADKAEIPVFLKENLRPLLTKCVECLGACNKQFRLLNLLTSDDEDLRQEMPTEVSNANHKPSC